MSYHLGVDLGTSYTAAAISRDGVLEMVSLGTRSLEIPSVVFLDPSGSLVVGESAERRGASDPARLAREFKRRLGDPAPILVGGTPFSAEALMAAVLRSVIADVTARQGEPPAHVTLTRPANWGPYKQELFGHVPALADLGPSTTATEPEAAAVHFASTTRIAPGQVVAIYDLGGGTFDAAVLRKTDDGFTTLGTPEGIEHLGGADFDDAVFEYVRRVLGPAFSQLDPTDPAVRTAAARLRMECVLAKESLSRDTEATIPVALPGLQTEVRLTRQDFEELVRPSLMTTVESLRRAVRSAKISPDEIAATVLAGGSSRIPLAAELITGELQLPVAVGTHPKHTVALGAALLAARNASRPVAEEPTGRIDPAVMAASGQVPPPGTGPLPVTVASWQTDPRLVPVDPATVAVGDDSHPSGPSTTGSGLFGMPNQVGVLEPQSGRRRRSAILIASIAAVAVALAAVLIFVQPWKSTAAGSPSAATGSAAASAQTTAQSPASSTVGSTESSAPPSSSSRPPTSSSTSSATPTTTTGPAIPAIIPTGATCTPTTLAFLGSLKNPDDQDQDGTLDSTYIGRLSAGMLNASNLAIDQFNQVNPDCQVGIKVFNTDYSRDQAAVLAPEIAADKSIVGVIAGSFSGEIKDAGAALEAGGLTFITPSAKSGVLNSDNWKGFARIIGSDGSQGYGAVAYLKSTDGVSRVAVVNDGSGYGGIAGTVAKGLGSNLVAVEVEVDPADVSDGAVVKILAAEPDTVYFAGQPSVAGTLLTKLRAAGYGGRFMFTEAEAVTRLLRTATPADAEGALYTCACAPINVNPEFSDAYRAANAGNDPTSYAAESYDATVILLKGLAAGNTDRATLAKYVRSYSGTGITKKIEFDDNGYIVGHPTWVMRIDHGSGVPETFEP